MGIQSDVKQRIEYFDFLRILATFAVVIIHVSAQHWYTVDVSSFSWQVFNFFDSLAHWAVPAFLMISGTLFLGSHKSIGRIIKENVFHITSCLLFWSAFYTAVSYYRENLTLKKVLLHFLLGHYHLWFLYVIIGLYLSVPILRKIVESEAITKYFLVMALLFYSLLPQLAACLSLFLESWGETAKSFLGQFQINLVAGFSLYFVLGYYLHHTELNQKQRKTIYALGIGSAIFTVVSSAFISILTHTPQGLFYDTSTINIFFISCSIFVFTKYHFSYCNLAQKTRSVLQHLSKYCFGAYLIHVYVLDTLDCIFSLNSLSFNPILSVLVISLLTFVISLTISGLINQIPVIKKYIV